MKSNLTGYRLLLASMLLLFLPFPASGDEQLENFETGVKINVNLGPERGITYDASAAPDAKGLSGHVAWQSNHFPYGELIFSKPYPVISAGADNLKTAISLDLYATETDQINDLSIRLRDAKNETFQVALSARTLKKGWNTVKFEISSSETYHSWGPVVTHRFEYPVNLAGLAFTFNPEVKRSGEFWFDNLRLASGQARLVETTRTLDHFEAAEFWRMREPAAGVTMTPDPANHQLRLVWEANAKSNLARVWERMMDLKDIGAPKAIALSYRYTGEAGMKAGIHLLDRFNKRVAVEEQPLLAGANTLTWQLAPQRLSPPFRIEALYFTGNPGANGGELLLQGLRTQADEPVAEAIQVDVETGSPLHLVRPGQAQAPAIRLSSCAGASLPLDVEVTLENYEGQQITLKNNLLIPAQNSILWRLPVSPNLKGIWWVRYQLRVGDDNKNTRTGKLSFAVMEPAGPAKERYQGSFILGVCGHPERWSDPDVALELTAAGLCGSRIYRSAPGWGDIQPAKDVWNFKLCDRVVDLAAQNGMEIQMLLGFSTYWAAAPEKRNTGNWHDWCNTMPDLNAWKTYVETVAKRYQGKIRYWEIWNEPDLDFWLSSTEDYLTLLRATYPVLKSVSADNRVMTGGFAGILYHPARKDPLFQYKVIEQAQDSFDIHAYHSHGNFNRFQTSSDKELTALRDKLKSPKPLFYNETAISSPDDMQHFQADTLFKKVLFAKARGAMGYQWYDLRNDGYNPKDQEQNFGLLTTDFYPKAAYLVFNTIARNYLDKEPAGTLQLPANCWGFVFANSREQLIAAWNENASAADEHILIRTDATSAALVDLMDNRTPLAIQNGKVILPISARPVTLALSGAQSQPVAVGPLLRVPNLRAAVPGYETAFEVEVVNPRAAPSELTLDWLLPKGITSGKDLPKKLTLPADGMAKIPVSLQLAADAGANGARSRNITMCYTFDGQNITGRMGLHIPLAIYARKDLQREADFVLEERGKVVNLCEALPSTAHLTWKGKEDLSARIWLARDADALILRVKVLDSIHNQPFHGNDLWKADSIQFALVVPGQKGTWELGAALHNESGKELYVWRTPEGFSSPAAKTGLSIEPGADGLLYELRLPLAEYGLNQQLLTGGIQFNLIVNDSDELFQNAPLRKGWIQVESGLGDTKNSERYPFVVFE